MEKSAPHGLTRTFILIATLAVLTGCGGSGGAGNSGSKNPSTFTVGGTITGLGSATGLVLANGSDTLDVPANAGNFTMPTSVANGQPYDVTVRVNPTALHCSIVSGAGTVNGANVSSISVSCEAGSESVLYSFVGGTTDGMSPIGNLVQARDGNLYGVTYGGGANGDGVVFKVAPNGIESVLYSFEGGTADGANPAGGLIQANDGNLYGVTFGGGAQGDGTVYKITPDGTESVLYSFIGGTPDGAAPMGSLLQASDGNFYGVTETGGVVDDGVVFKINPNGTESVLYSFKGGTNDGQAPTGALIQATDGNFYGMTRFGGASRVGLVFKITPSGTESILYSFKGGTTDGENAIGSLIQGSDGNLYGVTFVTIGSAGANYGVVFRVTLAGSETVLHFFADGPNDGAGPVGGLIQASDGNFYGATSAGGANGDGIIFEITPSGSESILHSFAGGATDGSDPEGGLIQGSDGSLYGMSYAGGANGHGSVFVFD